MTDQRADDEDQKSGRKRKKRGRGSSKAERVTICKKSHKTALKKGPKENGDGLYHLYEVMSFRS